MADELFFFLLLFLFSFRKREGKGSTGGSEGRWAAYPGTKLHSATKDRSGSDPSPQGSGPRIIVGRVLSPLWNAVPRLHLPKCSVQAHETPSRNGKVLGRVVFRTWRPDALSTLSDGEMMTQPTEHAIDDAKRAVSSYRRPDLAKHVPQGLPVPPPASRKQALQVTGPLAHRHERHKYERRPWHLEGFP